MQERVETQALSSRIEGNHFFGLPFERIVRIFGYLTLRELYALRPVCKAWQEKVHAFPGIDRLYAQEIKLRSSNLWQSFPALLKDESVLEWAQMQLQPGHLKKLERQQLAKFSTFCDYLQDHLFTPEAHSYRQTITFTYLTGQIRFIQNKIDEFGRLNITAQEKIFFLLKDYLVQLDVFEAYLDLQEILTAMLLTFHGWHQKDKVRIVCDSPGNRWLRGKSLVFMCTIGSPYLLHDMLQQTICLHIYFRGQPEVTDPGSNLPTQALHYSQRLAKLDNLFSRLALADWQQLLAPELEKPDDRLYVTPLLIEAVEMNHPMIPKALEGWALSKIAAFAKKLPPKLRENPAQINPVLQSILLGPNKDETTLSPSMQRFNERLRKTKILLKESNRLNKEIRKWLALRDERMAQLQASASTEIEAEKKQEDDPLLNNTQPTFLAPQLLLTATLTTTVKNNNLATQESSMQTPAFLSVKFSALYANNSPSNQSVNKDKVRDNNVNHVAANTGFNWGLTLKITLLVLLAFGGISLLAVGILSFVGLPLLAIGLPLYVKILLFSGGAIACATSAGAGLYMSCSSKQKPDVESSQEAVREEQLPNSPNKMLEHTARMRSLFNPQSSADDQDGNSFKEDDSTVHYSALFT